MIYLAILSVVLSAGSLVVCLLIWWPARRRIQSLEAGLRNVSEEMGSARRAVEGRLNELQRERERRSAPPPASAPPERFTTAVVAAGPEVPPAGLPGPMNLSRRAQILRLERKGQTPPQIAAALGVTQAEVELAIKISRLSQAAMS
jgi:DNA-binding NarL/FixJ family response regulator